MEDRKEGGNEQSTSREPLGFAEHTRRNPGVRAHEQGWGLNEEERRRLPQQKQDYEGGTDYDYGARDFGDTPVDTSQAQPAAGSLRTQQEQDAESGKKESGERQSGNQRSLGNQRSSASRG